MQYRILQQAGLKQKCGSNLSYKYDLKSGKKPIYIDKQKHVRSMKLCEKP